LLRVPLCKAPWCWLGSRSRGGSEGACWTAGGFEYQHACSAASIFAAAVNQLHEIVLADSLLTREERW